VISERTFGDSKKKSGGVVLTIIGRKRTTPLSLSFTTYSRLKHPMTLDPTKTLAEIHSQRISFNNEEFYRYLIDRLGLQGFSIHEFTPYHFRINEILDVYPVNQRWHDIKANERGSYYDIFDFVKKFFIKPDEPSVRVHYDG
jgi:hypothetical protein